MTAPSPDQPHAQDPAEGSRGTGDAALPDAAQRDANESEDRISHDSDTDGVSDYVPDA
jgi:hypothetical protein